MKNSVANKTTLFLFNILGQLLYYCPKLSLKVANNGIFTPFHIVEVGVEGFGWDMEHYAWRIYDACDGWRCCGVYVDVTKFRTMEE